MILILVQKKTIIVEFGSYWHDKTKFEGISVQDHYGKRFFDHDFTDQDWIDFYNFGFHCIKEYLLKGVVENDRSNYRRKTDRSENRGIWK